jgi:hypothetical protein
MSDSFQDSDSISVCDRFGIVEVVTSALWCYNVTHKVCWQFFFHAVSL